MNNKSVSILAINTLRMTFVALAILPSLEEQQASVDKTSHVKQKVKDRLGYIDRGEVIDTWLTMVNILSQSWGREDLLLLS